MKYRHKRSLAALVCLLLISPAGSDQTLQTLVQNLHCANDQQSAASHIKDIRGIALSPPGLPYTFTDSHTRLITAAHLDKTLSVLYESAVKYPENHQLIEQALIQWNFCSVIDNGRFYDHYIIDNTVSRKPSSDSATSWEGFETFGLIPNSTRKSLFSFSTPYTNSVMRSLADKKLLQTYINHCLPHPDDARLHRSFGRNFISRVQQRPALATTTDDDNWITECSAEPTPATVVPEIQPAPLVSAPVVTPEPTSEPDTVPEPPALAAAKAPVIIEPVQSTKVTPTSEVVVIPRLETLPVSKPQPKPVVPDEGVVVSIKKPDTVQAVDTLPSAVVITTPANGSSVATINITNSKGFSGSVSLENRSFELSNTSLKLAVAYKPFQDSYWFVRSTLNVSQQSDPFSYSWGIGYDDWHPGTWALQLNHWGPLQFGDGLDFDNAIAEVSYKLKSDWMKDHNLSAAVALSKPISDDPVLSFGWSWNPYSHWFVRSTLIKPLDSSELNWSYGFGFTRYNPSSWSVEYNNWGVNSFPQTNFVDNGQLSLIYRWAF